MLGQLHASDALIAGVSNVKPTHLVEANAGWAVELCALSWSTIAAEPREARARYDSDGMGGQV